jgi:hypothetical protein
MVEFTEQSQFGGRSKIRGRHSRTARRAFLPNKPNLRSRLRGVGREQGFLRNEPKSAARPAILGKVVLTIKMP